MEKCLIVDDSRFMRDMIRDILTQGGYEVIGGAYCGDEAVIKYEEVRPDFVTMDINMPSMDGLDAAKRIMEKDPEAKIIMCSALMGKEQVVIDALQAGAKDYILKPFQKESVIETVERVLK